MIPRPAFLLAAFCLATGFAPATGEHVVQADLPGFIVGYHASNKDLSIEERVPTGETVERWTRMVTTQRFAEAAERLTPEQLLTNMKSGLTGTCPRAAVSAVRSLTISGRQAAQMRADCPRSPATGLPETFLALAIAGSPDMHMVQVAFRRVPSAADVKWAQAHLDSVRLVQ